MRGRKPKYQFSEQLAWHIFSLIVEGRTIQQVCKTPGYPSRWVIDKWRYLYPEFNELVEDARDLRGDWYKDQIWPTLLARGLKYTRGQWQPRGRAIGRLFWLSKYRSRRNFGKKRLHYGYTIDTGINVIEVRDKGKRIITPRISSSVMPGSGGSETKNIPTTPNLRDLDDKNVTGKN